MNIFITPHARLRLENRLMCAGNKINKVVEKAWNTTAPLDRKEIVKANKRYYNGLSEAITYRQLMGYLFVFDTSKNNLVVLVTVY